MEDQRQHGRKEYRRKVAEMRQEARNNRSPEQQLALLDSRLGAGRGAGRERARLQAMIEKQKSKK